MTTDEANHSEPTRPMRVQRLELIAGGFLYKKTCSWLDCAA